MIKTNLSFDNDIVNEFIKEIQSKLPGYDINVNNVNDFYNLLEEGKNCQKCKGLESCYNQQKGYYTDYVNGSFCYKKCRYLNPNKNSLITNFYIPERQMYSKIDKFDINSESRNKIFKYINTFVNDMLSGKETKGLYVYGECSKGKTFVLAMIANLLNENNIKSTICYFPDLAASIRNDYYSDKERYEEVIDNLRNTPILLVDDFGSENMTEWLRDEVLGPIINYRMSMRFPVFMSSNVEPKALEEHIAIDKDNDSKLKAKRIVNRLNSLMLTISMDDGIKYNR